MSLKPNDLTVGKIFQGITYDVDFYQRAYKWNDDLPYKPVTSLLKDIFERFDLNAYNPNLDINEKNVANLNWYYLNSFMTNNVDGKKYVVDGQQRLTTLTLILIALYHLSKGQSVDEPTINTVKQMVKGDNVFGSTYWMGFRDRKPILEDILTNNPETPPPPSSDDLSKNNIYKNYFVIMGYLKKRLDTAHKTKTFIAYFVNRILLVEIAIDNDEDVAMVFEVINDRGVPLRAYEILKGKLLCQINLSDRDRFVKIWDDEIKNIEIAGGESAIDNFFSLYFQSKYATNVESYQKLYVHNYHKSIFLDELGNKIKLYRNEANVRAFIENNLPYYVKIYTDALKYSKEYNKEYQHIYFNQLNDLGGQNVLMLSSINHNDKDRNLKMNLVSKSFDRLNVIMRLTQTYRSNDFNAIVISLNDKIRGKTIKEINDIFADELLKHIKKIQDRKELNEPFHYEFFKNISYTTPNISKPFLRYFFARVDHYISENSDLDPFANYHCLVQKTRGNDVFHIEHIITNNEKNISIFKDIDEFNVQRNRLGALLLLKGKDNESSGEELYQEKLKTYNVVGTYFAKTLLEDMYHKKVAFKQFIEAKQLNFKPYGTFTGNEIEERQKLLFNIIKLIWEI